VVKVALLPGSTNVLAFSVVNAGGPGGLLVEVNETTSPIWTSLRFPGQYYDPETDLHENGHRFYDPETGRDTAPEPLLNTTSLQVSYARAGYSMPTYVYAANNPQYFLDADGRRFVVNDNIGSLSGNAWAALLRLAANPSLAADIGRLAADPGVVVNVRDYIGFYDGLGGRSGSLSRSSIDVGIFMPYHTSPNARCEKGKMPQGLLPMSFEAILAHELGNAYSWAYEPSRTRRGTGEDYERAIQWENAQRAWEKSPLRPEHNFGPWTPSCGFCP
jgi:RHS repeat-associated protein